MIKIDIRSNETLEFQIGLSGIRQPDKVLYRLILKISDGLSLCFNGLYDNGELVFNIPTLKDYVPVVNDKQIPFFIEMVVDEHYSIIYESEMELLTIPEVKIEKITHVKPVKEEKKKPIKIEEKIIFKPKSKFAKNFEVYVKESEKE